MAVPGYEKFMLPILQLAGDGAEHRTGEAFEHASNVLGLSETDRAIMLAGGTQAQAYNRYTWAIMYLAKAKLLEKTGHGRFKIASRGREVLNEKPHELNNAFLLRFSEFEEFKSSKHKHQVDGLSASAQEPVDQAIPPNERLDAAYQELRDALAAELLDLAKNCSPSFFEQLVVDLLVAMGYGGSLADAGEVVGKSGDGGIDGTIKEDKLGLDVIYVQAKRWESSVGSKEIQSFVGSLEGRHANKGVFITTSTFSPAAGKYVRQIGKKIVLIDGTDLAQLMIDHGVGCTEVKRYIISKADSDYFEPG